MESKEPFCVRCARVMKTCCEVCEIYVSPGDFSRIANYTGQRDFCEFRVPMSPDYLPDGDDPAWRECVFRLDGSRRVLKRSAAGACTFLGPKGCQLPLDVRPLVCRLYPYQYTEHGILEELARGCPVRLLRPGQSLILALGMNLDDALVWHRQLYDEIQHEKDPAEKVILCASV
jgi:Fe-S-cluster containining protein